MNQKIAAYLRYSHHLPAVLFLSTLLLYAVWPWLPFGAKSAATQTIVFYGFSILGEVMTHGIFPAFREQWKSKTGHEIEFISSFAGSGTVRNQLMMGVPAHLALVSMELDALQLADAGVISTDSWQKLPEHGIVNRTPFVILVRKDNPKRIKDFKDLTRPGTKIVHPDPLTSGGAIWAIAAEFGAGARHENKGMAGGTELLRGIWQNVVAQAGSAKAARTQFENGFGDALITYEQELLYDRAKGKLPGEIVYPSRTILSEHTLVTVSRNIPEKDREAVTAFVDFLWSKQAQQIFVDYGFRSVDGRLNREQTGFGEIPDLFTILDLGGWPAVKRGIVDGVWRKQVLSQLSR